MTDIAAKRPSDGRMDIRYRLIVLQAACAAACMAAFGFTYDRNAAGLLTLGAATLLYVAHQLKRRQMAALGLLLESFVILLMSAILLSIVSCTLAATNAPYIDNFLVEVDRSIFGFSWLEVAVFFSRQPMATMALSMTYTTLAWQPFVLLGLFVIQDKRREIQQFTLAWLLAPMLCVVALPFAPALGGYLHYATSQADYPYVLVGAAWDFEPLIDAIRSGELRHLGASPIVGVVTFPSFHAAGAVILGWCGRKASGGAVIVGLNAAMLVSTIPIGGHYFIDVAGGVLVAILALGLARVISRPADRRWQHVLMAFRPGVGRNPRLAAP